MSFMDAFVGNEGFEAIFGEGKGSKQSVVVRKTLAAMFVCAFGADKTGARTKFMVMHPIKEKQDALVMKEAAEFMSSVLVALLAELPPARLEQILKDQDERLSFDYDLLIRNGKIQSEAE